jgi:hypothetical protein
MHALRVWRVWRVWRVSRSYARSNTGNIGTDMGQLGDMPKPENACAIRHVRKRNACHGLCADKPRSVLQGKSD